MTRYIACPTFPGDGDHASKRQVCTRPAPILARPAHPPLGDFTTDARVLVLIGMATMTMRRSGCRAERIGDELEVARQDCTHVERHPMLLESEFATLGPRSQSGSGLLWDRFRTPTSRCPRPTPRASQAAASASSNGEPHDAGHLGVIAQPRRACRVRGCPCDCTWTVKSMPHASSSGASCSTSSYRRRELRPQPVVFGSGRVPDVLVRVDHGKGHVVSVWLAGVGLRARDGGPTVRRDSPEARRERSAM